MATRFSVPVGFKFIPDEEQLLLCYLHPKLEGKEVPKGPVHDCNLYDKEPSQIWDQYKESEEAKDIYLFTQLKKKTLNGSRISRTVGTGTWKGEDSSTKIYATFDKNKYVIGYRKRFSYKNKGSKDDGRWIMHEYDLHQSLLQNKDQEKKYVICILRKNDRSSEKKKVQEQEQDDQEMLLEDKIQGDLQRPFIQQETTSSNNNILKHLEEYLMSDDDLQLIDAELENEIQKYLQD